LFFFVGFVKSIVLLNLIIQVSIFFSNLKNKIGRKKGKKRLLTSGGFRTSFKNIELLFCFFLSFFLLDFSSFK